MQNSMDWTKQYYSPEAQEKVEERKELCSPELPERVSRDWAQLFADVEAELGEDPAGEKVQALVTRWKNLVAEFTGGDPEIQKGLNKMYADQANWPHQPRQAYWIKPEVMELMMKDAWESKNGRGRSKKNNSGKHLVLACVPARNDRLESTNHLLLALLRANTRKNPLALAERLSRGPMLPPIECGEAFSRTKASRSER